MSCLDVTGDLPEAGHGCPHLLDLLHEEGVSLMGLGTLGPRLAGPGEDRTCNLVRPSINAFLDMFLILSFNLPRSDS